MQTSRELVRKTLEFENTHDRAPQQLWWLPIAERDYPEGIARVRRDFPDDITGAWGALGETPKTEGGQWEPGRYVDEWGCRFKNLQYGIVGEVETPLVAPEDEDWADTSHIHIPVEWLTFDIDEVNAQCRRSDRFLHAGCCPRPFEQLQFIRGTSQLYMDLMDRPSGFMAFIRKMHTFYCDLLEKWAKTGVDSLQFMDDWGSQRALLINPAVWREIFAPMYRDYIDIAHRAGKKAFMHSDGYILDILPDFVEMGLDAVNAQLFCMGLEHLAPFRGKITFWGEIDRQHMLPHGTVADIEAAVHDVYATLWQDGGCIAQCEFGAGANPDNVYAVYRTWRELTARR